MNLLDEDADACCIVDDVDSVWGDPELETARPPSG